MSELDALREVLPQATRKAWPVVARTVRSLDATLVGGTALAVRLQHRKSYDLDILVYEAFSCDTVWRRMRSAAAEAGLSVVRVAHWENWLQASVGGAVVEIVAGPKSSNPHGAKRLGRSSSVDGLAVASMPDLLAMKLDVIMYRAKLRDYIDIAAIDRAGEYRIEDGLVLHEHRYGSNSHLRERILRLLEAPGVLDRDSDSAAHEDNVLEYLQRRAVEVRAAGAAAQQRHAAPGPAHPSLDALRDAVASSARRIEACNAWMPRAKAYCVLPDGHLGHHRSS